MNKSRFTYAFITVSIVLGVFALSKLRIVSNTDSFHVLSPEQISIYQKYIKDFSIDSTETQIIILEKSDGWRNVRDFKTLKSVSNHLQETTGAKECYSIANLKYPRKGLYKIHNSPFLDLTDSLALNQRLNAYEKYRDVFQKFLSADLRHTLVFLKGGQKVNEEVVTEFIQKFSLSEQIKVIDLNYETVSSQLASTIKKDSLLIGLSSLIIILIAYYAFTLSFRGIALIGFITLFNLSWTFIFLVTLDFSYTIHMISIPGLITVLSFTDILHIIYYQNKLTTQGLNTTDLKKRILSNVKTPIFLTSFTNIIGLVIFIMINSNENLHHYALTLVFGVTVGFFSSRYLALNLVLNNQHFFKRAHNSWLQKAHTHLGQNVQKNDSQVKLFFLLVTTGLTIVVGFNFELGRNSESNFLDNNDLLEGKKILEEQFFGKQQAEIWITRPDKGLVTKETFTQIENIEKVIDSLFQPLFINSPNLLVKRYNRFLRNGHHKAFQIPDRPSEKFLKDLKSNSIPLGGGDIIASDFKKARIIFGYNEFALPVSTHKFSELTNYLESTKTQGLTFQISGVDYLTDRAILKLSNNLITGYGTSIFVACVLIIAFLKSLKTGLGLLVVNLLPLLIILSLIIILNITISPITLVLLSILIGICIDDSIYMTFNNKNNGAPTAFLPIFITSSVIASGLTALSFSSFQWLKPFGWIFPVGIMCAYLSDIFILPLFLPSRKQTPNSKNG